jgi:hypothetical protein
MGDLLIIAFVFVLGAAIGYVTIGAALFVVALPTLLFADAGDVWHWTSNIGGVCGALVAVAFTWDMW